MSSIISTSVLSLTSEPAVIGKAGKIVFANSAACGLLGEGCVGRGITAVFGADIAGAQAGSFIADAPVCGRHCVVRVTTMDKLQYFLFSSRSVSPILINDAFICYMRTNLMALSMSADLGRSRAEELGDCALLTSFTALMRSYYRLLRVLENASFVQAMQTGAPLCNMRETSLSALVSELIGTVKSFDGEVDYRLNVGEDIRLPVDTGLIRQLLLNLLANCRLHATGCTQISVSLIRSGECVVLSVSDNGCGMSRESLATVFDRYRHDFDICELPAGIGLGLSVVRGIAELHGGTVLLESREEYGTTVRISFRRSVKSTMSLRSPKEDTGSCVRDVLTGLADCLSEDSFREKYSD